MLPTRPPFCLFWFAADIYCGRLSALTKMAGLGDLVAACLIGNYPRSHSRNSWYFRLSFHWDSYAFLFAEKDVDCDVLWTWSYPSITETFRQVILRKCCLKTDKEEIIAFCFGQFNKQWFYIYTSEVKNSDALSKVGYIISANNHLFQWTVQDGGTL